MGDQFIKIIYYHGRSFNRNEDGSLTYYKEQILELLGLDTDTLDVFSVRNYYKHLGYDKVEQCRWLVPNMLLTTGLKILTNDNEMLKMCFYAKRNNGVAHVYYEFGVSELDYVEEQQPFKSAKEKELMYSDESTHPPKYLPLPQI
ncbi:hypothetical protein S83_055599 [Arachis hypogaea]